MPNSAQPEKEREMTDPENPDSVSVVDRDISMEKISNVALGLGFGWVFKTMCR